MALNSRFAAAAGLAAALSMAAMPAAAAELPAGTARASIPTDLAWNADDVNADRYRGYRYRRHRGVDAGDVLAGVLILGGIAAVASAASKSSRDQRYRDRDYRDRPYDYRSNPRDSRTTNTGGLNRAVDMCVREIERDVRVDQVNSVDRDGTGWLVTGSIYNGEGFSCRIDANGRIDGINFGRARQYDAPLSQAEDRQWDDDTYARARQGAVDGGAAAAYPGAPVDEDLPEWQEAPGYSG